MNARELATVLAALRFWQVRNLPAGAVSVGEFEAIEQIAADAGPSLDVEEIDALCERLNTGGGK